MTQIHTPASPAPTESHKNTKDDMDSIILWVKSVICFFDSSTGIDIQNLRQGLMPFSRTLDWYSLRRLLSSQGNLILFEQLKRYRTQIDHIVGGMNAAANDNIYIIGSPVITKRDIGLLVDDNIADIDWKADIIILFETHFPGVRGDIVVSDLEPLKDILIGGSVRRHEYEKRFEEYRTNITLFMRDFCPWMV